MRPKFLIYHTTVFLKNKRERHMVSAKTHYEGVLIVILYQCEIAQNIYIIQIKI